MGWLFQLRSTWFVVTLAPLVSLSLDILLGALGACQASPGALDLRGIHQSPGRLHSGSPPNLFLRIARAADCYTFQFTESPSSQS